MPVKKVTGRLRRLYSASIMFGTVVGLRIRQQKLRLRSFGTNENNKEMIHAPVSKASRGRFAFILKGRFKFSKFSACLYPGLSGLPRATT
jgi:hypothetical protein